MEDGKIVELYWAREESALAETDKKYGKYCKSIARAILYSDGDAEECFNDTLLKAWDAMPPSRPTFLKAFLGKITRHLALDRYDYDRAQKRNSAATVVMDEIGSALPETEGESPADALALKEAINSFLAALPSRTRIVFMRRYWYFCSVREIADGMGMSEGSVKIMLFRARERFKSHLEKKGIFL